LAGLADDFVRKEKPVCYHFDNMRVDPQTHKAWRAGQPLPLEPKAFAVLVYLLAHRERLVEKEELLTAVWPETFVTPNALTRVIAQLRKALGDDVKEARYIETVPTRGYRFIAEVQIVESAQKTLNGADTQSESALPLIIAPPAVPPRNSLAYKRSWLPKFTLALTLLLTIILGSLGIVWWQWSPAVKSTSVTGTQQITTNSGLDIYPAFSPDGSALTNDGGENLQPAWSPNGKQIVYHARQRGGLWVMPALGGLARQLTEFGSRPAWSPDGVSIVFQSDAPVDLSQTAFGALAPATLWIVSTQGGTPRQLTQTGQPGGGHGTPAWSPDGKRIAFVNYDLGTSNLWAVEPDGSNLKLWRDAKGLIFDPVFAPDGRHLYFSTASGNFRVWQIALDTNGLPLGETVELANTGNSLVRHLTIAPDGNRLAYSSLTANSEIGSVPISPTTQQANAAPTLLTQDTNYRKTAQSFSPDGTTIAYSVWRLGADGEVWLMDANGENTRQLTASPATVLGWLPNGTEIALNQKGEASAQLIKANWQNGRQALLTNHQLPTKFGRLSPDGNQLVFNRRTGSTINIWKAALDTGAPTQLTFDPEMLGFPVWSPDGRWLAAEMKRGDDRHVVVLPSAGGAATQLTFNHGQSWPGGWSPDGDKIAFAGQRNGVWNVWWVSRNTKQQQQLTHYTAPNSYVRYPAWSPRGNQIVYEFAETTGNIWLMELK
jgi:Tol biopolymer transport system component/DNA-binding winged helix-turn-helix (wHTH) protein